MDSSSNTFINEYAYNETMNTILQNTLYDEPVYRSVISEEKFKQLNKIKYSKEKCKNDKCPILCVDFSEEDDIILLECGHCFEPESIKKWLKEHKAECPVCRFKLDSVEIRYRDREENQFHSDDFRRLHDIDISQFIAAIQRSHNLLNHSVIYSNIHNNPLSALATNNNTNNNDINELYIPSLQMMRAIHYDDDFYDFVYAYQQLFNL